MDVDMKLVFFSIIALCLWSEGALAFWGSESTDAASGLNVATGFDVNTIATVAGTVKTLPERKGQDQHAVMLLSAPQGTVTVVLGPWWYWEKQAISVTNNQGVSVTGSLAQGKDGTFYLFAQKIENRNTGEAVILRSESGKPLWSQSGGSNLNGNHSPEGTAPRSGAGNRGSGARGGRR